MTIFNVNGIAHNDEPAKNLTAGLISSTELYSIFQLIILPLQLETLLFWVTLAALLFSASPGSSFQLRSSKNLQYTVQYTIQTKIATGW